MISPKVCMNQGVFFQPKNNYSAALLDKNLITKASEGSSKQDKSKRSGVHNGSAVDHSHAMNRAS